MLGLITCQGLHWSTTAFLDSCDFFVLMLNFLWQVASKTHIDPVTPSRPFFPCVLELFPAILCYRPGLFLRQRDSHKREVKQGKITELGFEHGSEYCQRSEFIFRGNKFQKQPLASSHNFFLHLILTLHDKEAVCFSCWLLAFWLRKDIPSHSTFLVSLVNLILKWLALENTVQIPEHVAN